MAPALPTVAWINANRERRAMRNSRQPTHMTIFYTVYEAIPLPESEDFDACGGAYINCWVSARSEEEASKSAYAMIRERGWKVVSIQEGCREVTRALYEEDEESRGYYDQAVVDEECYVFHQWPVGAEDDDDIH